MGSMSTMETRGLSVQQHEADRAVVITFHDSALVLPTTGVVHRDVKREVQRTVEDGHRHVVFNWENVTTLDSSGLGLLLVANRLAKANNARIYLCNASRMVGKLLHSMRMGDSFRVADSEDTVFTEIRSANQCESVAVATPGA